MSSEKDNGMGVYGKIIEKDWRICLIVGLMAFLNPELLRLMEGDSEFKLFTLILNYIEPGFRIFGISLTIYAGYLKLKKIKDSKKLK